jgi:RNA polymerase sigma-70 factor (ECF subfamily)
MQAMGGLTRNQQEVIRLKFQNALSYREISDVTGLSVSNVGYLIHMGLRQMRQQLGVSQPLGGQS